ncbi:MAG: XRE family transcriptional regulator [Corynebacterium urealyticum]|uniref:XRE family transcriptional regulator n=1 Tax=Corynebacterium urealyticum TaxID=43771 RepID=A0A2W5B8T2_9CORY|nr:MAG: XRE family transcriptional regulator [Corynebacterium urealyticum]
MTIHVAGAVPDLNTLPIRLRVSRDYAGLTQTELADRMGVSRQTIANAETGARQPRKVVVTSWAFACGVDAEWLRTGETRNPSPDGEGLEARHEGFEPPTFCLVTSAAA